MVDIEFLEPAAGPSAEPPPVGPFAPPARRAPLRSRGAQLVPVALWVAAAILAVIAPFQIVYTVSGSLGGDSSTQSVDGWGRYTDFDPQFPQHDARYGILTCIAAGLLLITAGLALLGAVGRPPARRRGLGLGLLTTALLGGTLIGLVLQNAARSAALHQESIYLARQNGERVSPFGASRESIGFSLGWTVWLLVIAIACGLLATLIQVAADAPTQPWAPVGPQPSSLPPLAPPPPVLPPFGPPPYDPPPFDPPPFDPPPFDPPPLGPPPFDPRDEVLDTGPPAGGHQPIG